MKKIAPALMVAALLGGCTSHTIYAKVGASAEQTNATRNACEAEAYRQAPPFYVVDRWPIYATTPSGETYIVGWDYDRYDANLGRRDALAQSCMAQNGFERIAVPYCKKEQTEGRDFDLLLKTPVIDDNICAMRLEGGGVGLVDLRKGRPKPVSAVE